MERAYNFHDMINYANSLNQLSAVEYGKNELQFGWLHNKMKNVWADLHPLEPGEVVANLANYSGIETDEDIVCCPPLLKECLQHHGHKGDLGVMPGDLWCY